jgi:hypothetical protein
MIHYKGEKIGLLNDKNVNWEARTSESGLFLGRTEFYATFVPYLVSVAGIEATFYFLNWNKQFAHILRSNSNAIRYNTQLGYRLCEGQENVENQKYEMTRERFELAAGKIRKAVKQLAVGDAIISLLLEPADFISGIAQKFEELLKESSHLLDRIENHEGIWYKEIGER